MFLQARHKLQEVLTMLDAIGAYGPTLYAQHALDTFDRMIER